jgi:hypothetical protein
MIVNAKPYYISFLVYFASCLKDNLTNVPLIILLNAALPYMHKNHRIPTNYQKSL